MTKFLMIPALALGTAVVTPALADDDYKGSLNVPRDQWLSINDVTQKLAQQGFQVRKIEVDDGTYEVKGTNSAGVRVEAHVHPATGEILKGYDDDRYDD